jgi:hypothetical protein
MNNRTFVIGVGMTKFDKPGTKEGDYPDWAKEAGEKAVTPAAGSGRADSSRLFDRLIREHHRRRDLALGNRPVGL